MDISETIVCMKKQEFVERLALDYKSAGLITRMYYRTIKDVNGKIVDENVHIYFSDGREQSFSVYADNEKAICKDIARAIVRAYG